MRGKPMYDRAQFSSRSLVLAREVERPAVARNSVYRRFGKRGFDIAFVLAILPFLLPLIGVLALLVRRDGAPAFFLHERVGRNGEPFTCFKLRTMVADADARLQRYLEDHPEKRAIWERDFKLPDDPRVTPTGRLLRRLSLDELPQFFNVLLGQMSIVGPRPVTAPELAFYGDQREAVLSVRPGITGPWQVGGRNDLAYIDRVQLDLGYVHRFGFAGDLRLICATVVVALRGTGL